MAIWDRLVGLINQRRREMIDEWIAGSPRVDEAIADVPLEADRHYVRISLAQMYLKEKKKLGQEWYPAVNSLVRCTFGDAPVFELPNIVDSSRMLATQNAKGDVVVRNVTLLPLIPFKGGEISVAAGLFAMEGKNDLKGFLGVMSSFAGLLAVPQLSTAMALASPLADGIQTLIGGSGGMHLGYHDTYVGTGGQGNVMRPGYRAIVRAPDNQVDRKRLVVANRQLREGSTAAGAHTPFERADFMLLYYDLLETRDDWNHLSSISTPFREAVGALELSDEPKAQACFRQALVAAMQAPELTGIDRRRVIDLLKRDYQEARNNLGFRGLVGRGEATLQDRMDTSAMSIKKARELGEPTYDEIAGSLV